MIASDVPLPNRRGAPSRYPWREMSVGDSTFMPLPDGNNMATAARVFSHANREYGFMSRTVTENGVAGVRVWRYR